MLNGLPWKQTDHSLIFEIAPKYCISDSFLDYEVYSISFKNSKYNDIWIKFAHSCPFQFTDSQDVDVHSCRLLPDHVPFALIHGPNVLGSYAILFITALDFTFTARHIHNWTAFLLWPSLFILSGAIRNCPLLFSSSILDPFWPGWPIFWHRIFFSFHTVHGVLCGKNAGGLPLTLPVDGSLSELSTVTLLGWPCMAWLIASLSYPRPFATTRLQFMKGHGGIEG